jgi:hypothetical protein
MKSGPDVFADALVPRNALFRSPVPSGLWPLIFPRSRHLYTDHRRPVSLALPGAGFRRRPVAAPVEGQLVEYEPEPGVYLLPWSVSVGKTLARLR